MTVYTETTDRKFAKEIMEGAPRQSRTWLHFDHAVMEEETEIPFKYKELMAIAVALTTQCPYCIEKHTRKAKEYGVTQEEIAETITIAAAIRSGAAMGYGLLTMKAFQQEEVG